MNAAPLTASGPSDNGGAVGAGVRGWHRRIALGLLVNWMIGVPVAAANLAPAIWVPGKPRRLLRWDAGGCETMKPTV